MAENEEEGVLETETVKDEDGSESEGEGGSESSSLLGKIKSKINFSTSMMIYIAIGLAVLLIAIGGYLFFASGDEAVDAELSSVTAEQDVMSDVDDTDQGEKTAAEALGEISLGVTDPNGAPAEEMVGEDGITIPDLAPLPESTVASPEEEKIELPPIPEMPDVSGAVVALPLSGAVEIPVEDAEPLTPEDKAMELFKLREQALILEEENRRLKQRLSRAGSQDSSGESKSAPSKPREREPELSKPTWGDFAPVYRGP